jgi:hypothetical protein
MTVHWHDDEWMWCPCDERPDICVFCRGHRRVVVVDGPAAPGSLHPVRLTDCPECEGTGSIITQENAMPLPKLKARTYSEAEAIMLGRRKVCYTEGHRIIEPDLTSRSGGVQGITEAEARKLGVHVAASDQFICRRCDAIFTVTYPEIGQEATA